jgi:hypothetical protein
VYSVTLFAKLYLAKDIFRKSISLLYTIYFLHKEIFNREMNLMKCKSHLFGNSYSFPTTTTTTQVGEKKLLKYLWDAVRITYSCLWYFGLNFGNCFLNASPICLLCHSEF